MNHRSISYTRWWMLPCLLGIVAVGVHAGEKDAAATHPGAMHGQKAGAEAGMETIRVEFYPAKGREVFPIAGEYTGKRFAEGWRLEPSQPQARDLLPEQRFLLDMVSVIRNGSVDQFSRLWEPEARLKVLAYYADKPTLWERLKEHYHRVTDQRLVNIMRYGDYALLQVIKRPEHLPAYVTTSVVKHVGDKVFLSNDLQHDAVHMYFANEYATRLVEEFNKTQGR